MKLIGSYPLKATARDSVVTIDLAVTIPDDIFQEKDYLDHRYFYKRACYLAFLAKAIKSSDIAQHVKWTYEHVDGDTRRPVIILQPNPTSADNPLQLKHIKAHIRLIPSISRSLFPAAKLVSTRCNIRKHANTPTPLYNAAILADSTYIHFLPQIYSATHSCPALIDAILLGKIWLRKRGFSTAFCEGGFGGFEWSWFLGHLLRGGGPNGRKVLDTAFSSFQLFRGALNSLVLTERIVGENVECLDVESGVNVFYKMTPMSYRLVYAFKIVLIVVTA